MEQPKRVYDDFNQFVGNYRDIHNQNIRLTGGNSDYFSEYRIKEIFDRESGNEIRRILDVGCGDGNAARFFRKYFPKAEIIGIDISEEIVANATSRGITNAEFIVYDGANMPFPDNHFDLVFMVGTLHHVNFALHESLLKETCRVLAQGGVFYNFEHNPYNPVTRRIVRDCVFDKDAVLLTPGYLMTLTEKSGFKNALKRFTLFFPRHRIFRPLFFLEPFFSFLPIGGQYYVKSSK